MALRSLFCNLLATVTLGASVEFASERLFVGRDYQSQIQILALPDQSVVVRGFEPFSHPPAPGGPCLDFGCEYIARFSSSGTRLYYRYLGNGGSYDGTLGLRDDLWIFSSAARTQPDFDLAPTATPNESTYLVHIDLRDGSVLATVRLRSSWVAGPSRAYARSRRLAVDRNGGLWIGGYATAELPVTPDAIQPWIAGGPASLDRSQYPGSLIRLAPDGSRITYATYLGDGADAVGALVLDQKGDIYAAGTRIWKLSPDGVLQWSTWLRPGATLAAAIGPDNDLFIGGCTTNATEPFYTTASAFQSWQPQPPINPLERNLYFPSNCYDGFIARLAPDGGLIYSTLLSGPRGRVNFLTVNARNETFFAGILETPLRDTTWQSGGRMGRLDASGTAVIYSTGYPPWIFNFDLSFATQGDQVLISGTGRHRSVDGVEVGFIAIERLKEHPETLPRLDTATLTGTLSEGFQLELVGQGFCAAPDVMVEDRIYVADTIGSTRLSFSFNSLAQPPPASAFALVDQVSAYYTIRVRCDGQLSAPLNAAIPYRLRPTQ